MGNESIPEPPMATFDQLKISASARPLVDRALARAATPDDQAKVKAALVAAAQVNGNKVLSTAEVQAVVDAFEQAAAGGAPMTSAQLGVGIELAHTQLKSMASLGNLDGVEVNFTFQQSLEKKLIGELAGVVERAKGKPVEINMMIFEFQSDGIQKAIEDTAKNNPNVKFRIIGDSGQASAVGGNALPELLKLKLPNIEVKFKKDFPYKWDDTKGSPVFSHNDTKGLNHHKGFSALIDGRPDRLVTGSFNWSNTADTKNYEDLTTYTAQDAATRRPVEQYTDEFAGFWNNSEAALSPNDFANFKDAQWNAMLAAHGKPVRTFPPKPSDAYAAYTPAKDDRTFDVNGFRPVDKTRLTAALGSTLAKAVISERTRAGRFASMEELLERVPKLATVDAKKLEGFFFGSGKVSLNAATKEELDAAGFTPKQAQTIIDARAKNGDFESVDDLLKLGFTKARVDGLRDVVSAVDLEAFFNARAFGAPAATTGYGSGGTRTTAATGADGTVSNVGASVTVGATDLFNKAKAGEPISVAMYGMSPTAPEVKALIAAAKRGSPVRIVINDDFSASTIAAIKALKDSGVPIDIRVQSAKTMHEKFGVVGDDSFSGSANFSESSSTKHSEDRFTVKNHPEIAAQFQSQFELLWAKSKIVT